MPAVGVIGVHHVAMAVDDLETAVAAYGRLFGASVERRGRVESQGVDAVYLRLGAGRVELVTPLAADTPVGRFLAKRGPGLHHVAFEVESVREAVDGLARGGATVVDSGVRRGLTGHDVAFVHPDSLHGVLAEVVQHGG